MQSTAVPCAVNWQSNVKEPEPKTIAQVALPPLGAGMVTVESPLESTVELVKPLLGLHDHASAHDVSVMVHVEFENAFVHACEDPLVSSVTA